MKKIRNLSESNFLKLFFAFISLCFIIAAVCMPDRATIFEGLWKIQITPCRVTTNYFSVGGFAATFLNMGLVGLVCLALFHFLKANVNNVSTLAFLLTVGFCSWGINLLNIIPTMLGVVLYAIIKKEKLSGLVNAMLFSTGIAPIITELLFRYPSAEVLGFNWVGTLLALVVGLLIGVCLPAGLAHAPNVHKGYDLYSAAVPVGMTAFLLNAILYKAPGLSQGALLSDMSVANGTIVNIFCGAVFVLCIVFALLLGCTPKMYWKMLRDKEHIPSVSAKYGNGVMLMNVGIFGLFILGYYNLVGASFNGVTFGIIFCMLACCNSGSNPKTVWPIMAGYVVASVASGLISKATGGEFSMAINAQGILVGLCYANGLSPITSKYGWPYSFVAAMAHYCMVTMIPSLHGGFCLYNGGFTAALVCLVLVPPMEKFFRSKQERMAARAAKKAK